MGKCEYLRRRNQGNRRDKRGYSGQVQFENEGEILLPNVGWVGSHPTFGLRIDYPHSKQLLSVL